MSEQSRFLGSVAREVAPYVPGAQPKDKKYIKLNANESPYPPSPTVQAVLQSQTIADLRLYTDPYNTSIAQAMADAYGLTREQVFVGGGSDEVLAYAFMAFFDQSDPIYFPDITYGFYKVYSDLFKLIKKTIPLRDDFTIDTGDYCGLDGHCILANPNAPTGIVLAPTEIRHILERSPNQLVVIDEAYIDYSEGNSCIPLIAEFDNLLVIQTFSKSRALAGMRIGFAFGHPSLIAGLDRIKFSFNPFNMDPLSAKIAIASLADTQYLRSTLDAIATVREKTALQLTELGFAVLPSQANFLFVSHPTHAAAELQTYLAKQGILVRYFNSPRISNYLRITIGTPSDMEALVQEVTRYSNHKEETT